jgi:exopolysaccharide biosynthesis polyprenyl glycosylphosphotransferase
MTSLRREILVKGLKLSDMAIMVLAFAIATIAVFYPFSATPVEEFLAMRIKVQNFVLFLGLLVTWHIIFALLGLYNSKRLTPLTSIVFDVMNASTLGTLIVFVTSRIFSVDIVTPLFLVVFWATSTGIIIVNRIILRRVLEWVRLRGRNLRYMLIAGTNQRALDFARKIDANPELGYNIVGFVDTDWNGNGSFKKTGYKLVTDFNEFHTFLNDHAVDEVTIALPMRSHYQQASRIASICDEQGIVVRHLSDIFNLKLAHFDVEEIEGEPLISHRRGKMEGAQLVVKRVLDFSLSIIALILLSPFFIIVSLLIKFTSPGPVFFIQDRMGLNRRIFRLYKFRTMIHDAEATQFELEKLNEMDGPVFKIKNDPRITPIGTILRKFSIDEILQFINVLKGDMSLVGPRPLPIRDYNGFNQDWHRRRFSVRPGITCLWQVNGRNNLPFEKWMELDMEYIDQWSLGLDFKVLVKTIPSVFKGSGAV